MVQIAYVDAQPELVLHRAGQVLTHVGICSSSAMPTRWISELEHVDMSMASIILVRRCLNTSI